MEEWEEPLHPDPMVRTVIPLSPTKQPQSHKKSHSGPSSPIRPPESPVFIGVLGRSSECQTNVHLRQSLVHRRDPQRVLQVWGCSVRPMCVRRGVSWGVRAPYDLARDDHLLLPRPPPCRPGRRRARHRARRLRQQQRQLIERGRQRPRQGDPGLRALLPGGDRPPHGPAAHRPRSGAEQDPAHQRPRREDHRADRQVGQGEGQVLRQGHRAVARRQGRRRDHRLRRGPAAVRRRHQLDR